MTKLTFALALVVAASTPAFAQDAANATRHVETYKVKKNDSLELIAAEFYGSRNFQIYLMSVNKMDHKAKLRRGQRLKVPVPRPVTAAVGDTWTALAEQYLEDPRRARFLAEFNGRSQDESLPAGTQLFIPYHMEYTAESNVRLSQLALTFLLDRKQADMLKQYNFLERNSVAKGDTVIIPIHVKVNVSRLPQLDAESSARRETRTEMQASANEALPKAHKAWRAGDYDLIKDMLNSIETGYLDTAQAVELLVLLGSAHVAFDDRSLAITAFSKALSRDTAHKLSAYRYSPKIREIWLEAGGEVDETSRD